MILEHDDKSRQFLKILRQNGCFGDDESTFKKDQIQPPSYEQPGPLLALGNSHRGGDARSVYLSSSRSRRRIRPGVENGRTAERADLGIRDFLGISTYSPLTYDVITSESAS